MNIQKIQARCKFEPRDLWIGLFWDTQESIAHKTLDLYFCVLPTLLIHFKVLLASEPANHSTVASQVQVNNGAKGDRPS